jgi:hypothetical protein
MEWHGFESRMFDSQLGRWIGGDPVGQFDSPYLGMGNNPFNGVDPDGEYWEVIIGAVVGAYAGGVISSRNFNPAKWENNDWAWAGVGAIAGGFIGYGMGYNGPYRGNPKLRSTMGNNAVKAPTGRLRYPHVDGEFEKRFTFGDIITVTNDSEASILYPFSRSFVFSSKQTTHVKFDFEEFRNISSFLVGKLDAYSGSKGVFSAEFIGVGDLIDSNPLTSDWIKNKRQEFIVTEKLGIKLPLSLSSDGTTYTEKLIGAVKLRVIKRNVTHTQLLLLNHLGWTRTK